MSRQIGSNPHPSLPTSYGGTLVATPRPLARPDPCAETVYYHSTHHQHEEHALLRRSRPLRDSLL